MGRLQSGVAGGDINPARFVKLDTTTPGQVLQASTGERVVGVSQIGTRRLSYIDSTGKAAISGEPIQFYDENCECQLELGGTVAIGDYLKSDSAGRAVTSSSDGDQYGAQALQAGTNQQLIKVKVLIGYRGA